MCEFLYNFNKAYQNKQKCLDLKLCGLEEVTSETQFPFSKQEVVAFVLEIIM